MHQLNLSIQEIVRKLDGRNHSCQKDFLERMSDYKSVDDFLTRAPEELISQVANLWGRRIGNLDIVRPYVTTSESAFSWAMDLKEYDLMRDRVVDPAYAYWWAYYIGDRGVMINRINKSGPAFWWAKKFGNRDRMKPFVVDVEWVNLWNKAFPEDKIT